MATSNVKESLSLDAFYDRVSAIEKQLVEIGKNAAKPIKAAAEQRAPVENPNIVRPEDRHLKHSIKQKVRKYAGGNVIVIVTTPNYKPGFGGRASHLQEFGYKHSSGATIPGKAWFYPAVDSTEKQASRDVTSEISKLQAKVSR